MFEALENIDNIRLNFSEGGLLFMNIALAFIMFGVALGIKIKKFKDILDNPKSAIVGFLSQVLFLPGFTFLLILVLDPPASIAMGMLLIAACPGGNISNLISSIAKANVALSVSLTAFSTLTSTLLTPINFALWGSMYVRYYEKGKNLNIPVEIDFLQMFMTVFLLLGVPLLIGMWFRKAFPRITIKILNPIKIASVVVYMTFIIGALYANLKYFAGDYFLPIVIMTMLLNAQTLFTGYFVGTITGVSKEDRRTITIETGIQNSGLALVLIFNPKLFDGNGGMAFMAAWWGIWQMVTGLGLALILSKIKIKERRKLKLRLKKTK